MNIMREEIFGVVSPIMKIQSFEQAMELAAAGTPFLYFPLRNHFEQNFHVAHRLDQYQSGRKMIFSESSPDLIAQAMVEEIQRPRGFLPVEADGARRAAAMLAELL